jgi:hypothetical protein
LPLALSLPTVAAFADLIHYLMASS